MRTRIAIAAVGLVLAGCEVRTEPADKPADTAAPAGNEVAAVPATPESSDKPLAIAANAADVAWGPCPEGLPDGCQLAVLHGNPAKPNADVFLKVPGGSAITPHWHSSAERIMLVAGSLAVKYQGHPQATLDAGTYAFGPARLPHKADCRSAEPCILFIAFEGPVDRHSFEGQL